MLALLEWVERSYDLCMDQPNDIIELKQLPHLGSLALRR